jgi:hypothetical protein
MAKPNKVKAQQRKLATYAKIQKRLDKKPKDTAYTPLNSNCDVTYQTNSSIFPYNA